MISGNSSYITNSDDGYLVTLVTPKCLIDDGETVCDSNLYFLYETSSWNDDDFEILDYSDAIKI